MKIRHARKGAGEIMQKHLRRFQVPQPQNVGVVPPSQFSGGLQAFSVNIGQPSATYQLASMIGPGQGSVTAVPVDEEGRMQINE